MRPATNGSVGMRGLSYLDFDLLIERAGDRYRARVLDSPAGEVSGEFAIPFSDTDLELFVLRMGRSRGTVRGIESPAMEAAKDFGGRLYDSVFAGDLAGCLRSSLDEAGRAQSGLRIRLRLSDVPELADLPWEFLYNRSRKQFLVLSAQTPIVRYLDLPEPVRPLSVQPPLRVLVMISNPDDAVTLDVEREWANLRQAAGQLEARGQLALERMDEATLPELQRRLRRGEYHVFHFIGHGGFDPGSQDGVLLLEDQEGHRKTVSGQFLGALLHDHAPLRLAVLNACEGARTSRTDPFAGVAQSLVLQGVPSVIAMQFEITDEAAITLTGEFYGALADGYPLDAALAEARKATMAQGNDVEWAIPVLYLRSPDGQIFDVQAPAGAVAAPAAPGTGTVVPDAGQERTGTVVPDAGQERTGIVVPDAGQERTGTVASGRGPGRWVRSWRVALGLLVALLVATTAVIVVASRRHVADGTGEAAFMSIGQITRLDLHSHLTASFDIGGHGGCTCAVTAGAGSAWIASDRLHGAKDANVVQLDEDTGSVIRVIRVGGTPRGIHSIAFGRGNVWLLADRQLVVIDPRTGHIVRRTSLRGPEGDSSPAAVAVGIASTWVTDGTQPIVWRVSGPNGVVPIRVPAPGGRSDLTAVAVGAEGVWVLDAANGRVWRIDPKTNEVVGDPIEVGGILFDIAVADERPASRSVVWVTGTSGIVEIDPSTNEVVPTSPGTAATLVTALTTDGSGTLWGIDQARDQPRALNSFGPKDSFKMPARSLQAIGTGDLQVWVL